MKIVGNSVIPLHLKKEEMDRGEYSEYDIVVSK